MKTVIATLATAIFFVSAFSVGWAQTTPIGTDYPDTLWAETDTFYVAISAIENQWAFATTQDDTVDFGTDGYAGAHFKVWTEEDTLTIPYVNSPYAQRLYIPIVSPNSTIVLRQRFNPQRAVFSEEYIQKNTGQATFSIPETYELANVILSLSDCSKKTGNHPSFAYTQKVADYFSPFKNHPLIQVLNQQCESGNPFQPYYNFRENSICFAFENDQLTYVKPYAHIWGNETRAGLFREFAYLVQDFADQSNFRTFFQNHLTYYQKLEQRAQELMPIKEMWDWLEEEFPNQIQSYKVIFSPLIGGSHSTSGYDNGSRSDSKYNEVLMFINSTESVDGNDNYSEKQKQGLMSGVVFTEIDHNYVNPTTAKYREKVNEIFGNRDVWARSNGDTENYPTPEGVFNEYMTHAVYCLYVHTTYDDEEAAQFVIDARKNLMTDQRQFFRFHEFNQQLLELYENKAADQTVADLYPGILEWAESVE